MARYFGDGPVNVLVVGATGAGKSTLSNLLLFGEDCVEHGFPVGDGPDSMTTDCRSITMEVEGCNLQVTDTPGVPDTDRRKTLVGYDKIIHHVRASPWLNAIIIMVEAGRARPTNFSDWRALLRQFNTLPCAKFMVCRKQLPPGCTAVRKQECDAGANELMKKIVTEAQLTYVRPFILHNMDGDEIVRLREAICAMPRAQVYRSTLRTYAEIKAIYDELSRADTRMKALVPELDRLRHQCSQNEDEVQVLDAKIEEKKHGRNDTIRTTATIVAAAGAVDVVFLGAATLLIGLPAAVAGASCMGVCNNRMKSLCAERNAASARIRDLKHEIERKDSEDKSNCVDQKELEKAKNELVEMESLQR